MVKDPLKKTKEGNKNRKMDGQLKYVEESLNIHLKKT